MWTIAANILLNANYGTTQAEEMLNNCDLSAQILNILSKNLREVVDWFKSVNYVIKMNEFKPVGPGTEYQF